MAALAIGSELDACDKQSKWYEATIVDERHDKSDNMCWVVHFRGWDSKFDELIKKSERDEDQSCAHPHRDAQRRKRERPPDDNNTPGHHHNPHYSAAIASKM